MTSKPPPRKKIPARGNGSSLVGFQNSLKQNKNPNVSFEPGVTVLTAEEVSKHQTPSDCWTVISGVVYNISPFMEYHPGGRAELLKGAGCDCTALYMKYHPWVNADAVLGKLRLGKLVGPASPKAGEAEPAGASENQRVESTVHFDGSELKYERNHLTVDTSFETPPTSPVKIRAKDLMEGSLGIFRFYNAVRR